MNTNVVPMTCPETPCQIPPWGPFPPPWFGPSQPPWYPGANAGVTFSLTAPLNVIRGHFWWDGGTLRMFDGTAWVFIGGSGAIDGGGGGSSSGVVVSESAPGNPTTGLQWWNGSIMQVWDGIKWNQIGPGATVGPVPTTTRTFRLTNPTTLTVSGTAWTIVPSTATPTIDTDLAWDAISKKITPKRAGAYLWVIKTLVGGTGNIGAALVRNDAGSFGNVNTDDVPLISYIASATDITTWIQTAGVTTMNGSSDFMRLYVFSPSTSVYGSGGNPIVEGYLLP